METNINISVGDLKARFGGLLKDESESVRVLNPDTWPEDQASRLTFGYNDVADVVRHFKEPLERSGGNLAAIQDEWRGLKTLDLSGFDWASSVDPCPSGVELPVNADPSNSETSSFSCESLLELMSVSDVSSLE
ncbi:unnamed protein product [Leuciscus chuanchicus]